jgi:phage terminase large subunit-like protein
VPGYNPWDQAGDAWLDHDAALAAINWFRREPEARRGLGAKGEPFVLRRWQAAIVGNLFGWKRKDEAGRVVRRYRQCLIFVARGNGKTPLAAGIVALRVLRGRRARRPVLPRRRAEGAGGLPVPQRRSGWSTRSRR